MNNAKPIPTLTEKYHGKQALDAARWIGDALWWITLNVSPDEAFTAAELVPAMAEDGNLPTSSPAEVFPFVLELTATLVDYALAALAPGAPPDEHTVRQTRSALELILGDEYANFFEPKEEA
jgi:hypothetical protein